MLRQTWLLGAAAFAFALGVVQPAWAMDASTKQVVRNLTNDGAADYDAGKYEQARAKFQRAYDTARVPTIGVLLAQTQVKLGQLVLAQETYRQVLALEKNELWVGKTQEQAQRQAEQELDALTPRVPQLTLTVEGADASAVEVTIDGVAIPATVLGFARSADPGERTVVGKLGEQVVEQVVTLAEGDNKTVELRFQEAPGASPRAKPVRGEALAPGEESKKSSAQRTWGWVSLGVGAAGLSLGTAAGIIVAYQYKAGKEDCPKEDCPPSYWDETDSYNRWRTLSTVGFIAGGVATAAGITLLLTSPKEQPSSSVGLWISPASAGLRGSF